MQTKQLLKSLGILSVLLMGVLPGVNFATQFFGLTFPLSLFSIHSVGAQASPELGIDCGLGSTQAVPDPVTGIPGGDGTLDTSCTWIGDIDADGIQDPLVSDNPAGLPAGTGGGFTAEVRVNGLTQQFNGMDIQLSYDTRYLDGVLIDQTGLLFGGTNAFTLPGSGIDRATGSVRLAQVLLGPAASVADATLFRVRFDVVGVGHNALDLHDDLVVFQSDPIAHSTQDGVFTSASFFDPTAALSPDVSWTFLPSPEAPGSDLKFTATTSCTGCGALSYSWDTNSDGTSDATGAAPTITPPPPVTNRVVLTVTDGTNTFTATRRLPLTVNVQGPSTIAVNTAGTWTGLWLGGIAPYTGTWRFCPGLGGTANAVCAKPAPAVPATSLLAQKDSQLLSAGTGPGAYHFAGIYTDTLKITDTASAQIGPASVVTFTFPVEVTGSPAAFTVTVTNVAKANVNSPVTITATIAYNSGYTASFRSSSFDVTFDFGDGSNPVTLPKSGCSTAEPPASPCTASTDHTFTAAGPYNIKVKAQETAAAAVSKIQESGPSTITINPLAAPLCDASAGGCDFTFDPTSPTVGKPVTFTATVNGGTTPYLFDWNFGDGSAHGTTNPVVHSFGSSGPFTVTLTITDSSSPVQSHPVTHTVTVAPQPVTPLCDSSVGGCDFASSPASPTEGKPVTFTATVNGGTTPYSFDWNFGDGSAHGTTNPVMHSFAPGPYTVTLTITDSSSPVQTKTVTHSITVAAQPVVLAVSVGCGSATSGKPVTCTATATGGSGGNVFAWTVDGTVQGGQTQSSFTTTFATKGSHAIGVTVTDNSQATASDQTTVTVTGQPLQADFTFVPSTPSVGDTVMFTATASGGTEPYSYSWNFGDGSTGSGASTTHPYATGGTKTVVLTVTDGNSAEKTASHDIIISVPQMPLCDASAGGCDFVFEPSSPTVGKPVSFTATVNGGLSPYTFDWDFGDSSAHGTSNPATHMYTAAGPYSVMLTITDSSPTPASSTVTHSLTVIEQPTILSVTIACGSATAGKPVTCTATAVSGTQPYTYAWSVDGTVQPGETAASFTTTFATKGTHTMRVDVTDDVQATAFDEATFTVTGQPLQADFTFAPSAPFPEDTVTFTATVSGGTEPYSYSWDFGDTNTGTGNPATHSYLAPGTFTVALTVTDGNNVQKTASHDVVVAAVAVPLCDASAGGCEFTVQPASPTVGKPATFTATVNGGASPYSFDWDFGDGSAHGTTNPVTHTYSAAGPYAVVLTITDSSSPAQTSPVTHSVTVIEQPTTLTVDFQPEHSVVGNTDFVALVIGGTPPYTCSWTFGDGSAAQNDCNTTHNYTVPGTFSVTLSITDSGTGSGSKTKNVTVDPPPLLIRGKVRWTHHLAGGTGATERFVAKVFNPSSFTLQVTLTVNIFDESGNFVATVTNTEPLPSGTTDLAFTASWNPTLTGRFSFTANLSYSMDLGDLNGDGTHEMLTGTDGSKSGTFAVVP